MSTNVKDQVSGKGFHHKFFLIFLPDLTHQNNNVNQVAVIGNLLSPLANGTGIKAFKKRVWRSSFLRELNFSAESPSTIQHMDTDFVCL